MFNNVIIGQQGHITCINQDGALNPWAMCFREAIQVDRPCSSLQPHCGLGECGTEETEGCRGEQRVPNPIIHTKSKALGIE